MPYNCLRKCDTYIYIYKERERERERELYSAIIKNETMWFEGKMNAIIKGHHIK
jgi:hypothetical protein